MTNSTISSPQLLDGGTKGCGSGSQLGCNGRNRLSCTRAYSDRLGSDGGDRPGRDGSDRLRYGDDEGPRIGGHGRLSEDWLGYGVYGFKSENDGWIVGNRVVARTESGLALLARMSFDKDNPADRSRGTKEEREV